MTKIRSLATTLLLSFSACTQVIADIVISPSRPSTNEAFDITVSGGFMYRNFVTGNTVSVTATNINIHMYAPILEIVLWMPTAWETTASLPPLASGEYLVTAYLHSGDPYDYLATQTANVRITRTPFIDMVNVDSSQQTNQVSTLNLSFKGNTTTTFIAQSSTNLLAWTNEVESLHMTNEPHTISFPMTTPCRFYRVVEDADP